MRVHTRLGASILLTLLSLVTLVLLLPSAGVTGLHRIAVGTSIDQYAGGLWKWVNGKQQDDSPVRIVVFGDSWVDGAGEEKDDAAVGRGKSWAASLCEVVSRSSLGSLAGVFVVSKILTRSPGQLHGLYELCRITALGSVPGISSNGSRYFKAALRLFSTEHNALSLA
jgi:hypothetical protein